MDWEIRKMRIAILGPWNFDQLSAAMEKLITESQCYLFTVVCGGTDRDNAINSIGYKWAKANGAPVEFITNKNIDKLINKLVDEIDFVVALNDGNGITKKIIMKMSMLGKHGRIEIV